MLVVLYSDDSERTRANVERAGGRIIRDIFEFPGGRRFHFTDPDGNELAVWSDKEATAVTPGSDHHEDAPGTGRLIGISIDCSEPTTLAEFYRSLTGWAVTYANEDVVAPGDDPVRLGLQRVPDHRRPAWPGPDKQLHLDFSVSNLDEAEQKVLALGATRPEFQPGGESFRVYQDLAGHLTASAHPVGEHARRTYYCHVERGKGRRPVPRPSG